MYMQMLLYIFSNMGLMRYFASVLQLYVVLELNQGTTL